MSNEPAPTGFPKYLEGLEQKPRKFLPLSVLGGDRKHAEAILAEYRKNQEAPKISYLGRVRRNYLGPWSKGARYLYRELIRTLELEHAEATLLEVAKTKAGRKKNFELAARIYGLKAEGKTVRETREILAKEGTHLSHEAIEAYLKTRRKRQHF